MPPGSTDPAGSAVSEALLTFFAVGCPICNKVVVIALGTSGALAWFAPIQPYLGVVALGLLAWALRVAPRRGGLHARSRLSDGRRGLAMLGP